MNEIEKEKRNMYKKGKLERNKEQYAFIFTIVVFIVYSEINRMLDVLNKEREVNAKLREDLNRDENKRILKFLDENIRFK